jgi:hypothetical protein
VRKPLDGVWAKLDRGDEHVRSYERQERCHFASPEAPATRIRVEIDRQTSECVVICEEVERADLPLRLGATVGDAIHCYRCALDQLIYLLAFMDSRGGTKRIAKGQSLERTMFPASTTRANFKGAHVQDRLLAGLTQKHRAMLKRFQPYRGWQPPDPHPVQLLDDLSNDDKHRVTQPALVCPSRIDLRIEPEDMQDCTAPEEPTWTLNNTILRRPLEPETELCRVSINITGPDPQVKVKGQLTTYVGFRNGAPTLASLEAVGDYVRRIVRFFVPEFDRPVSRYLRGIENTGRLAVPAVPVPVEATYGTIRRGP